MRKLIASSGLIALAMCLTTTVSAQAWRLVPLTTFGINSDGSVHPDDVPFLTATNQLQRGLAYNPMTGHLLVVSRVDTANPTVNIVDAATGSDLGPLALPTFVLGGNASFKLNLIGVADDGAIYAGNLTSSQVPAEYRLYRWADETDPGPTYVYYGDPSGGNPSNNERRWGDTMAVRGAGVDTQILIANRGTNAAVLRPSDSSMTSFYATTIGTDSPVGGLGYGLAFGAGDTFWGTSGAVGGGPLLHEAFDLATGTATNLQTFTSAVFPATVSPIMALTASNWLVALDTRTGPDMVRLYDISTLANPPVLLERQNWVTNINNNVAAGALAFGTNGVLYALDADNGLMAFTPTSVASNPLAPSIMLQPAGRLVQVGSNVVFTASADGDTPLSYQWVFNGSNSIADATSTSFTRTNAQIADSGAYNVVVTNVNGAVTSSVANLSVIVNPPSFLAWEPFEYTAGDTLTGKVPPSGQGAAWLLNSGTSGTIETGNLLVPGLAAPTGNRFTWPNVTMSERLPIGTNLSGTFYYSFALRIDDVGPYTSTTSETMAGFTTGTSTSFGAKLNVLNATSTTYQLGLYKFSGIVNGALATNIFTTSDIVFIVGRYSFNPGSSDDTCDLWLNPDPATFGTDTPPPQTIGPIGNGATDLAQLDRFFLRCGSTSSPHKKTVDEIRVGQSWAEVTPPFVPPAPTLSVTASAGSATLAWPTNYNSAYILQGTPGFSPTAWGTVTNAVGVDGTNYSVTVAAGSGARFFRLIK